MFRSIRVDQEYRELCASSYAGDPRVSEVASVLMLAQTGVYIDDATVQTMSEKLSSFANEFGLDPEDVQAALTNNEPQLQGYGSNIRSKE